MNTSSKEFLRSILEKPSPSGFEKPVATVVREYMKQFADETRVDTHGNTWGVLNPKGKIKVMLSGHCDEIGLMVTYISDQGFIAFAAIGGVNVAILQGARVTVHTKDEDIPGVICVKPIHLMSPEERGKAETKIQSLWVDIGAKDKKDAERYVNIGDPMTINLGFTELLNGNCTSRAFDDRIGSFIVAETLRLLKGKKFAAAVYAVATVQEEIGLRGATTSTYGIDPDCAIAVDVGFASDCPDVDKKMVGDIKLGDGPILHRGPNINPVMEDLLAKAAKRAKVKTQMQSEPRATGTDANAMQLSRGGKPAALVSIPNRYMHSPSEVCNLKDVEDASKLLAQFILDLKPGQSFLPW